MSGGVVTGLDPRVALAAPVVVDTTVLAVGTEAMEVAAAGIAAACLLAAGRPVGAAAVAVAEAAVLATGHVLVPAVPGRLAEVVTLVLFATGFTYRFVLAGIVAGTLVGGVSTGGLQAALGWARVPRVLAVPSAVALRFLPVVLDDARAICRAMLLRGVVESTWELAVRPAVAVRHLVLPLVASALRTGDELAASALLRGLGAHSRPTSVVALRIRARDVVVCAVALAVAAWGVCTWLR